MKRALCCGAMCFLLMWSAGRADARPGGNGPGGSFGLGLMVGDPAGISAQLGLSGPAFGFAKLGTALNFAAGLDILNDKDLYFHLDYVMLISNVLRADSVVLPIYLGVGGFVVAVNDTVIGARVPFGIQLDFRSAPIHLFLELVFRLQIVSNVHASAGGALGLRYFF